MKKISMLVILSVLASMLVACSNHEGLPACDYDQGWFGYFGHAYVYQGQMHPKMPNFVCGTDGKFVEKTTVATTAPTPAVAPAAAPTAPAAPAAAPVDTTIASTPKFDATTDIDALKAFTGWNNLVYLHEDTSLTSRNTGVSSPKSGKQPFNTVVGLTNILDTDYGVLVFVPANSCSIKAYKVSLYNDTDYAGIAKKLAKWSDRVVTGNKLFDQLGQICGK